MRHRRKGRVLGRSPSHQRAMLVILHRLLFSRNVNSSRVKRGAPKVAGRCCDDLWRRRKKVRPLVEKCITIAKRGLLAEKAAEAFSAPAGSRYS
jgi:large subunit ribosomal protein L17